MAQREEHASEILARFGRALFGDEWGAAVARLADVNPRTVTRIKAAALEGREYPAAEGVLRALAESVELASAELRQIVRRRDRLRSRRD